MANLPSKKRPGRTITTGISIDVEVAKNIRSYADERQWSFSKAIENLSKIALEKETKKTPMTNPQFRVEQRARPRIRRAS